MVMVHVAILVPIPMPWLDMVVIAVAINLAGMVVPMASVVPTMGSMPPLRRVVRPVLVATTVEGSLVVAVVVAMVVSVMSSVPMGISHVDV